MFTVHTPVEQLPDLIGYELNQALEILAELGYGETEVLVTKPVLATEPVGGARLVRLKMKRETLLQVVVAYDNYLKGGA